LECVSSEPPVRSASNQAHGPYSTMNTRLLRPLPAFFVAILLISVPFRALAWSDFPPLNPQELKIDSLPGQPGASAFVLYHEEIDDDKAHYHQTYYRIKVLTEAGRERANVELPYNNRSTNITDIHGRTIHADGAIIPFEGKPFEKVVFNTKELKYKVKAFTMPDVQVGSIIEYRYTLRYDDDKLLSPRWTLSSDLYQKDVYYSFTPYDREVMLSHGRIGRGYSWTWLTPHNEQPVQWPNGRIDIKIKDVPAFDEDEYLPPGDTLKYFVHFYYSTARNVSQYWQEEGKYWSKEVDHFASKSDTISAELGKIVAPTDTLEQKVRKIYAYVSKLENTTYLPVRTAEERLATGLKENKEASDVLRNKSGSRDDITRLFIAMVRQAGVPAQAHIVTARDTSYFMPQLMDFDQLDNEVAVVQIDGKDVYLDPGTRFCPYGVLYWKYSAAKGLRQVEGKGAQISDTEISTYKENQTQRRLDVKISSEGVAEGALTVVYFGQESISHRLAALKTDAAGRTKDLEDEVKDWLPSNSEVSVAVQPDWDSDKPFAVKFKVSVPMLSSAGKRVLMPAHLLAFNQHDVLPHAERKYPVYFNYPYTYVDEIHINLPESLKVENLPAPTQVKLNYALYASQYQQSGRQLMSERQLLMGGNVFPVEMYKELKGFFQQVHTADQQQILLKAESSATGN
jgi:transglutaminase-like putative cysteine protease